MNANDNDADFCLFKLFKDNKKTKYLMFVLKYEIRNSFKEISQPDPGYLQFNGFRLNDWIFRKKMLVKYI